MFRMELDLSPEPSLLSNYDFIVQILSSIGVPVGNLNEGRPGLVAYVKKNRFRIGELVSAILHTDVEEVGEDVYRESLIWLQWLMFEGEPEATLEHLAKLSANQQGVCGSVWGHNDIAYRCRTCEHDPTCAICVPCFENGDHKGHDYSIIYTGGGCCDCGDITAWKREGFCSKHKGAEQIQPLPENFSKSLGPVLDLVLSHWKDKLLSTKRQKASDELTPALVEMLLDFCKRSESLLSFIARRVYSSAGLLKLLFGAERFLKDSVVVNLHELLLKFLSDPMFKYEFSKVFVVYYPEIINATVKGGSDSVFKKFPLLSTFSVQILTVPTLTPRLVEEMNLLGVLFQCLGEIFTSCTGEDGRLQVAKWANLYETTLRVAEDIRFVMSHSAVTKYLCRNRRELLRQWMRFLTSVQGIDAEKRETGSHTEEENDNVHLPFILLHSISNILSLLVDGAFSQDKDAKDEGFLGTCKVEPEDQDSLRHAKVGRLSEESYVGSTTGKSAVDQEHKGSGSFPIPSSALWLIYECFIAMENWLAVDNTVGPLTASSLKISNGSGNNLLALKRTLSRFRRGRYIFKSSISPSNKPTISSEAINRQCVSPSHGGLNIVVGLEHGQRQPIGEHTGPDSCDDNMLEGESTCELEGLQALHSSVWPDIAYDVSSQNISVHIPLHRVLSMALRRALKECYGESGSSYLPSCDPGDLSYARCDDFLDKILEGCHPYGFSAFVMEHPLRIRVFCAEVHAGMWRRNGDAPILSSEWYRSVRWSEQGQELDLFLLQFCAGLAPPDLYVQRLVERFGLSNYLSLNLEQPSEHEPVLVAEMLTLIIQIVKERRFCGLTSAECLRRELIYKLSIGDATRSQLVKSLPRDLSKIEKTQEILDTVAEYSHPSGMSQGMYKLRALYWKELDLYHPRWNSRDRQAAEERYAQFCNVSALTTQLPRWTKIYHPFKGIAKVATCKTLLRIVRAVLFYAVFTDKNMTSRAPDGVLLTALHLLALALDVCRVHKESGDPLCHVGGVIPLLAFSNEEISTSTYGDQSMLSLLVSLMRIHEKENSKDFMEAGYFSLSSLILNLIKTIVELEPGCMTNLQKLAPQLANQFSCSTLEGNERVMGAASDSEKIKAKSRERQAAILERMRAQQSKFLESVTSDGDDEMDDAISEPEVRDSEVNDDSEEAEQVICSLCHDPMSRNPVSFLVLLQKSRLLTFVDREPPTWEQVGRSGKEHVSNSTTTSGIPPSSISNSTEMTKPSQLREYVQSAVNDFSSVGQPSEMNAFVDFVKARFPSLKNVKIPYVSKVSTNSKASSLETWEENVCSLIRGLGSSLDNLETQNNEEQTSTTGSSTEARGISETLFLGKYIAMLPKEPPDHPSGSQNGRSQNDRMQIESNTSPPRYDKFCPAGGDGIYVSSCGHAVHQGCLDLYLSSLRERYIRRIVFEGGHIVDPDQGEFLCPVCRGLANSVLPAIPRDLRKAPQPTTGSNVNLNDASSSETEGSLRLENALSLLHRAANIAGTSENLNALPIRNARVQPNLEPILRLLCGMYYPGHDKILETGRVSPSLIMWDTLKYSLTSAEIAARSRKHSLGPNYSIGALYKELNSSGGFIFSLLLAVTQKTRTTDSLTVLARLRGLQLFARSLCQDTSPMSSTRGNMLYILESIEDEVQYTDIQLWRRASEPVLAHDAFSSIMWILFCLPWPLLSCKESFLSFVHVFYSVTLTQAIITYCKKTKITESELGFHDNLITDIFRLVGECGDAMQCFDFYNVDLVYGFNESIRSLTFPYLRRCALLWKLVNGSSSMPFGDVVADLESAINTSNELAEVENLEKLFDIPSIDAIINDGKTRLAATKWLAHFSQELGAHNQHVLRCAPAVPFKLMILPHIYQDLLQRYIKKPCPDCGDVKEEPALCLMCGKLCSPNWKTCCRESGCQTHAMSCGGGIGVFLLIRRTTILLQRSARQAPWPSPYLDAFGEEDSDMQRGKPLFLNEERYAALTHMVASHGLDRSSKVLRQTTTGSFFMF